MLANGESRQRENVKVRVPECCSLLMPVFTRLCSHPSIATPSRSEVSLSSSPEASSPAARQLTVQVLLHSEGLQASQQDDQMLLSQEDLFDGNKMGEKIGPVLLCELL